MTRRLLVVLLLACSAPLATPALAQKPIPRPRLAAGADTNDSRAYLELGNAAIARRARFGDAGYYEALALLDPIVRESLAHFAAAAALPGLR
ncbi:MAG TPA: hypothetical protein VGD77_14605 [Gemmatimonadaceae bacterium]